MLTSFVRCTTLALVVSAFTLAACGDPQMGEKKLEPIHAGMTRDSVMLVMGKGPMVAVGSDSVRVIDGYRHMRYLIDGKMFEVLYYREEPGNVDEPIEQAVETPVVLADGQALGWGWKFYVEAMKTYKLPTPLMEKVAKPAPAGPSVTGEQAEPTPPADSTKSM